MCCLHEAVGNEHVSTAEVSRPSGRIGPLKPSWSVGASLHGWTTEIIAQRALWDDQRGHRNGEMD